MSRNSFENLSLATLRLIDLISDFRQSQVLIQTAYDYLTSDHCRKFDKKTEFEKAIYLLSLYEQKLEEFNEEFNELSGEAQEALFSSKHRQ